MKHTAFNDDNPGAQLGLTILLSFTGSLVFICMAYSITSLCFGLSIQNLMDLTNPKNVEALKFIQLFLSAGLFIMIPLVLAWIFTGNSKSYLKINTLPSVYKLVAVVIIMIFAIPAINLIAALNAQIKFPGFMSGFEKYLIDQQKDNDNLSEVFLNVTTLTGFAVNILMIAIIPAIGEEFLFRGVLQRIFSNIFKNKHYGIIISGFIFSAIHMQFYGFFPRWLLGIMFGYMFIWSGSLWLPILAHFINNFLDVIAYYLVNSKLLDPKILDFGSAKNALPITAVTAIIMGLGLYWLFSKRRTDV